MQTILSIDASIKPAQALVVQITDSDITILEQHFVPSDTEEALFQNLEALPKLISAQWTNAIIFVPGKDYVSLNLELPFKDPKQLGKVVRHEVQDIVPFELDSFTLHHKHVGSLNGHGEDIHVGLFPKLYVSTLLSKTRPVGLDPFIITTPAASLQGLYEFHGENLSENSAIVLEHADTIYLAIFIDKALVTDRSLTRAGQTSAQINSSIELAIKNAEDRYHRSIPILYHICEAPSPIFQPLSKRELKALSMSTLFPSVTRKASLVALMGSIFAQDYPAPAILTNFRTGEFTFTPSFAALISGLRDLLPYIATLILISFIGLFTWYLVRDHQIKTLQNALDSEIKKIIPDFHADPGNEADALQKLSTSLQDSLKVLGSPLAASPLDVLAAITEDISTVDGALTRRVSIKNGEARVEGTVPDYKTRDKVEASFKKHKSVFCSIKNESPSSSSKENARDFQIILRLCEQ